MKKLTFVTLAAFSAITYAQPPAPAKVQKATVVVDHGFKPSTIKVKAGQPVQITFDTKNRDCATSVIFDGLKINKPLTKGKKTVVTFTVKKAGTYAFACPMKMMTGSVIAK